MPRSTCMTTLSWTFESRPTTMESKSPRSTAPCQPLAPSSTVTSPTSTALGATRIILSLEADAEVLQVRGLRAVTAREDLRSLRYTLVDRLRHVRRMVPRHERAHLHVLLQSGAEAEFLGLVLQFREERGRDVFMKEQLGPGPTHLPRVLERPPEGALHRPVHPRVRQHDLRVLAAELQGRGDHAVGDDP